MSKEKKYAVIVVAIGVISILLISYLAMRNPIQPTSDIPISPGQDKSEITERPNHSEDKNPAQSRADIAPDKAEYPVTPSQISSIPQMQPASPPKETEQERLLYTKALGVLKPKKIAAHYEINLIGIRKEVLDKMPRIRKYPYNKVTVYQENCEKAIKDLEELIRQYPDSSYIQHYQETLTLLKQMLQEDKEFFYDLGHGGAIIRPPVQDRHDIRRKISPEETVKAYIHYLRKECLLNKIEGSFKMCIDQPSDGGIIYLPDMSTISCGRRILQMGNTAVPELVKLLDDRRPITVDDEINIVPTRFYRYSDAATDILQTMFSPEGNKINPKLPLAQRLFPLEIPQGEYFSEYLEKQTPQDRQNTINYIKTWVEETLTNPANQEEPK